MKHNAIDAYKNPAWLSLGGPTTMRGETYSTVYNGGVVLMP